MTAAEYLHQVYENRRQAFNSIVRGMRYPYNKRAALALDMQVQTIKSLRSGQNKILESRARQIEAKLGMEFGAMDRGANA